MSPARLFSSALGAFVLAAAAQAQSQLSNLKHVSSLRYATLDLATGELSGEKAGGAPCWSNTDTSTFFSFSGSTGGIDEWIAAGDNRISNEATGCGDPTDIIRCFTFGYASNALDTSLGGPGAMMGLNFYDGTAIGSTAGTFTRGFLFSGLPGTTAPSSTSAPGYVISVDLVAADREFVMGDGAFGFGWVFFQVGTGPLLCFVRFSGGGPDGNGQIDAFDWYSPPAASGGTLVGTFFFGLSMSSWYLALEEEDGVCGAASVSGEPLDGGGLNPLSHSATAPVIGSTYTATCTSPTGAGSACVLLAVNGIAPDFVLALGGLSQEIEVDVFTGTTLVVVATAFAGGVATFSDVVPIDLELCGLTAATQCVGFGTGANGSGVRLSTGLNYVIGF